MEIFAILMSVDNFKKLIDILSGGYIEELFNLFDDGKSIELDLEVTQMLETLNEPTITKRLIKSMIKVHGVLETKEFLRHALSLKELRGRTIVRNRRIDADIGR
ncbi:MAG: hypothetical protein PHE67_08005 [Campylobacterales bacterium]|nr:hypothetical protein [Campylobacterales bacterium]